MLNCLLVSVNVGGRRVAYIVVRGVPDHKVRPEPARLTIDYKNSICTVKMRFLSEITLEISLEDDEHALENCDDIFIEISTSTKIFRFRSCYKIGDQWYIDYIGTH